MLDIIVYCSSLPSHIAIVCLHYSLAEGVICVYESSLIMTGNSPDLDWAAKVCRTSATIVSTPNDQEECQQSRKQYYNSQKYLNTPKSARPPFPYNIIL